MYSDFVCVKLANDSQPRFGAQRSGSFFCLGLWKSEMQLQQRLEGDSTCMIRMLIPVKYKVPKKSIELQNDSSEGFLCSQLPRTLATLQGGKELLFAKL